MTDGNEIRTLAVAGGQWGDEGKGKIVDLLAHGFDAAVRFNGGHNAGHTVCVGHREFALHLVPSGIVNPSVRCLLGASMVIDPIALAAELSGLREQGVDVEGRIGVSDRAALVLPTHRALDGARETGRGRARIGTTGRGIGPAYQDIAARRALRAHLLGWQGRLLDEARALMTAHNEELTRLYGVDAVDLDRALNDLQNAAELIGPMVTSVGLELDGLLRAGRSILFEGAQGVLLDIYHGSYPYVTSSSCLPALAAVSCGVSPSSVATVLGVMKAYETRVGSGPFPTEDEGWAGDRLRDRGGEYGTTTGRPRRCGWFDAVAARYAVRVAGMDAVALTKLDVLDGLDEVRVGVGYDLPDGTRLVEPPADVTLLDRVRPVYESREGWRETTAEARTEAELPAEARAYVAYLESVLGVPVVLVSNGPRRDQVLVRRGSDLASRLEILLATSRT